LPGAFFSCAASGKASTLPHTMGKPASQCTALTAAGPGGYGPAFSTGEGRSAKVRWLWKIQPLQLRAAEQPSDLLTAGAPQASLNTAPCDSQRCRKLWSDCGSWQRACCMLASGAAPPQWTNSGRRPAMTERVQKMHILRYRPHVLYEHTHRLVCSTSAEHLRVQRCGCAGVGWRV
jgi:hypothetical protein